MDQSQEGETVNSNDKADAAWDDYVSQQQEEKIEELERELNAANESFRKLNIHALDLAARIKRLEQFANRFLNPDDLGWAIGKRDRDEAREALGKERVESK